MIWIQEYKTVNWLEVAELPGMVLHQQQQTKGILIANLFKVIIFKINKNNKSYQMLLSKISQLPIELVNIIYLYIPLSTKGVLTSIMFVDYYSEKMKTMIFSEYSKHDTYIRDIVRTNRTYIFRMLISNALLIWEKNKVWRWKNLKFPDYLSYINYLTIKYKKPQIKSIIDVNKKYLSRKKPKKISSRNILWNS